MDISLDNRRKFNPFAPNLIVSPELFAGRKKQALHILEKLDAVRQGMHSSFLLHGEQGMGKTALAKLVRHIASSKEGGLFNLNFATSYYSAENGACLKNVIECSLNNITDILSESSLERLSSKLGGIFKDGKFSFDSRSSLNKNRDKIEESEKFFKDKAVSSLMNLIQESIIEDDIAGFEGLLIIIDDIHNIRDIEGAGKIFRTMIDTLDVNERGFFSFLLIGHSECVERFFKGDISIKRNFDCIEIDIMSKLESIELLTKGFKKANLTYHEDSMDRYIDFAGRHPYSLQILGHNLVATDMDNDISKYDWKLAIDMSAKELQVGKFLEFYSFNSAHSLRENIIDTLALFGTPVTEDDLRNALIAKDIHKGVVLSELIEKEIVKKDTNTGELSLKDRLFRTAILFHLFSQNKQLHNF